MLGRTLGHYRIIEKIGAGGMGVVYRAGDERLERDIALKILPAGALADEAARKRFRGEAMALSKLNHPNIATIYDFDSEEGLDFLAMEYISGVTLREKSSSGALPEAEVLQLGKQAAGALEAAHEKGIIHRDLKPGNMMVTPKGLLKVLDFGLAKVLRPSGAMDGTLTLTGAENLTGTLPYMAPEQLEGCAVDERTDIQPRACSLQAGQARSALKNPPGHAAILRAARIAALGAISEGWAGHPAPGERAGQPLRRRGVERRPEQARSRRSGGMTGGRTARGQANACAKTCPFGVLGLGLRVFVPQYRRDETLSRRPAGILTGAVIGGPPLGKPLP
jgi:serine/threonine protein kinase